MFLFEFICYSSSKCQSYIEIIDGNVRYNAFKSIQKICSPKTKYARNSEGRWVDYQKFLRVFPSSFFHLAFSASGKKKFISFQSFENPETSSQSGRGRENEINLKLLHYSLYLSVYEVGVPYFGVDDEL